MWLKLFYFYFSSPFPRRARTVLGRRGSSWVSYRCSTRRGTTARRRSDGLSSSASTSRWSPATSSPSGKKLGVGLVWEQTCILLLRSSGTTKTLPPPASPSTSSSKRPTASPESSLVRTKEHYHSLSWRKSRHFLTCSIYQSPNKSKGDEMNETPINSFKTNEVLWTKHCRKISKISELVILVC